jgi:hypothetical protein
VRIFEGHGATCSPCTLEAVIAKGDSCRREVPTVRRAIGYCARDSLRRAPGLRCATKSRRELGLVAYNGEGYQSFQGANEPVFVPQVQLNVGGLIQRLDRPLVVSLPHREDAEFRERGSLRASLSHPPEPSQALVG